MSPLVYIVMFGWIPFVLYLFRWLPAQRAVVVSFMVAWLFLPLAAFPLPGLPDYTKMSATSYGVLLATIIFDAKRFSSFQPGWLDLPMLVWCLCPFISSISNDLGWYDGVSAAIAQTMTWGLPYYLGRLYLNNLDGLRKLAIAIFAGGLLYVPLCLIEIFFSPMLHQMLYGFSQITNFAEVIRYGGFRPTVFMQTGLMVGAWMMAATLSGVWLWNTGVIKQLWGIPVKWLVVTLLVTTVLVKSTGALALLAIGLVILFVVKWFRTPLLLLVLLVSISSYLYLGVTGNFPGDQIVPVVSRVSNEDRAGSLKFRFDNEEVLSQKARQKMIFGWGGWGRSRVYDEWGKDISITDSLWIITFGNTGVVGLISLTASMLLPVLGFLQRYPLSLWHNPKVAGASTLAVLLPLYMADCLLNYMPNPVYFLTCGGIAGLVLDQRRTSKVTGVPLSVAKRYLVQQRQHRASLLASGRSNRKKS